MLILLGTIVLALGLAAGVWVHALELSIKAQTHDLVDGQWVKRGCDGY